MKVPAETARQRHAVDPSSAEPQVGALRLIVSWPDGRFEEDRILRTLEDRLVVRSVTEVEWTPSRMRENYLRFYGDHAPLPHGGGLESRKRHGPILVITATDPEPRYEERLTTSGPVVVSVNLFEAKDRFRALGDGDRWVHCADSVAHTTRDLMMLLGVDPATHLREHADPWQGVVPRVQRDIVGADGWDSLTQLFYALNHTVSYLVLRNFEHLPECAAFGSHDDVDLLTDRYRELIAVLHPRPLLKRVPRWGGRFFVRVAGETVIFDLRFVGDRYYDPRWARGVLERRIWCERGFFTPNADDYFETLAYHAIVQKRRFSEEYQQRLATMARAVGRPDWDEARLREPARAHALIHGLVQARGYTIAKPRDPTVFFNFAAAGSRRPELRRRMARAHRAVVRYVVPFIAYPLHQMHGAVRTQLGRILAWLRALVREVRRALRIRRRRSS